MTMQKIGTTRETATMLVNLLYGRGYCASMWEHSPGVYVPFSYHPESKIHGNRDNLPDCELPRAGYVELSPRRVSRLYPGRSV